MTEQEGVSEEGSVIRQLPGSLLRQAREAQGLTLGEVSGALKFSTRQIEALENDNHELLQGKTFLRGFIRAYARMLKLQPEALLAMLEAEAVEVVEQIVPPDNMGETDPVPFYRRHAKIILLAITVTVVVAGLAWFYNDESSNVIKAAGTEQTSAVTTPIEQSAIQTVELPAVSPVSAVSIPAMSGTAAQPLPPAGLSFEFSDRSWLEVRDGRGEVLLTGEYSGGQSQTAAGSPPYQLWIGKASAVKVTYKGQSVDLQPYTHDEVARLTLDK